MRFFRRSLVGLMLVALTVGLLAVAGRIVATAVETRLAGGTPTPPPRERVFSATVELARAETVVPVLSAYGEVRSRRTLELRSPRAGTVTSLAPGFEDGGKVVTGQLLMTLDPADATAARDIAKADMGRAQAEARDADRGLLLAKDDLVAAQAQGTLRAQALQRQRDLKDRKVGSDAAVETAALAASVADQSVLSRRAALDAADARVDQAKTAIARQAITLAEAERDLRDTNLYAAFDGTLADVTLAGGRILSASEKIGDLIDPTSLEVSFRVSTAQYTRLIDPNGALIPADLTVSLEVSGAQIAAKGRLDRVGAAVAAGQTGRLVYATLTRSAGFRPGDFVTVRVQEPALPGAVTLPSGAFGSDGDVLVLGDGDRLEAVPATLLRRQADTVILAPDGIAGREVVTQRSPLLGAGIKVKPVRPEAAAGADETAAPDMVDLTAERRASLVAYVQGNVRMPADAKARILAQLAEPQVPAQVVSRLEQRMGG